jgi:hypothetical protein
MMQIEPVENCDAGVFVDLDFNLRRRGHRECAAASTEARSGSGDVVERRSSANPPTLKGGKP